MTPGPIGPVSLARPPLRYRLLTLFARPALWAWIAGVALGIARGRGGDGVPGGTGPALAFTAQRFGHAHGCGVGARRGPPLRWLHAASVGEVVTALPLLHALAARGQRVLVTTATPSGAAVLLRRGPSGVRHRFLPIDVPRAVARFLDEERPASGWIVETELWPWLFAAAANRSIGLTIVSARLSARTVGGAARWLQPVYAQALAGVRVLARSEADANRFRSLGAVPASVRVAGDLKRAWSKDAIEGGDRESTDRQPPASVSGRHYALAASTHDGEERALAAAWCALPGDGLLVIVPRHPPRADAIERTLLHGPPGTTPPERLARHAREDAVGPTERLLLGDTFGELERWYRHAACAFIGGSLVPRGGHNLLEAARHALPLASGPHTHNFDDTVRELLAADALQVVPTPERAARWLHDRLGEHAAGRRHVSGERARAVALRDARILPRYVDALLD